MSKTVYDSTSLEDNAGSVVQLIRDLCITEGVHAATVYVRDNEGNPFSRAYIEEETLMDGSKVYNLVFVKDIADEYRKT